MIFKKRNLATSLLLATISFSALADNSKVPPHSIPAPTAEELGFMSDEEIDKLAANFQIEKTRSPSGTGMAGSEDMLSPEYVEFRNKLIKVNNHKEFHELILSYDAKYDSIPASANDLKFIVAKMSTWLPFKGIVWRMAPLVHNVATAQQALVTTLKNFAEQVQINEPSSHVQAHLLYLSMPTPDLVGKEIKVESDFVNFVATDVYASVTKAVKRIEKLRMANVQKNGRETPIVFDGKIRFGENAFNNSYDDFERFKVVGEAERFATLARFHRRMSSIAFMAAYNWNGHLALRKDIGRLYGVGVMESALFDSLPGADETYVHGVSRETRTQTIKKYKNLYSIIPKHGSNWMRLSYNHLHSSVKYLTKTWESIKNSDQQYITQLDPEVFMARKEQVEIGLMNMNKLVGATGTKSGVAHINGSLSGDEVVVDVKGFYENPPQSLQNLLPTKFAKNEDLDPLKKLPEYKNLKVAKSSSPDVLEVKMSNKNVHFRNYLYGRSTGWNTSTSAYGTLFPGSTNVGDAMRILNETRGSKLLTSGLTAFIR